jgi:hypothetical protein
MHKNIQTPTMNISIFWSHHLTIVFHLLYRDRARNFSEPVEKFTDWEWFQSLDSHFLSPRIRIKSREEANQVYCNFIASTALACRLSTSRVTLSNLNGNLPGLESLPKHQRSLKKLAQVTLDPEHRTAVNWVTKAITRMVRRKVLGRW